MPQMAPMNWFFTPCLALFSLILMVMSLTSFIIYKKQTPEAFSFQSFKKVHPFSLINKKSF